MVNQAPTERIAKIIEEIKRRTGQQAYALTVQPDRVPTLFDSKFGGLPYWDLQKPYPTDPRGEKLLLLAQINFDDAETEAPLPQTGMLQFFIAPDDVCGLDFEAPDQQDTFRVVYHEQIDRSVTAQAVRALGIPQESGEEGYTPVCKEAAVSVHREMCYMSPNSYLFDPLFRTILQETFGEAIGEVSFDTILNETERQYLYDALKVTGHRMLGYPFFTQSDPREFTESYQRYDTLLFQMDSEMVDGMDYVLWGDCGVGNFFIARADLEKCDFSSVLYNWDCF